MKQQHRHRQVRLCLAAVVSILFAATASAQTTTDYDDDNDNLIDVRSLVQLNAMRYDVDGNGAPLPADATAYAAAFPNAATGMGCASTCRGYELRSDLDFDTDGDGDVDSSDTGSYANWVPIIAYAARFDGNLHTISNLTINRSSTNVGLFGTLANAAAVTRLGLVEPNITRGGTANGNVGALVGSNNGHISVAYALGGTIANNNGNAGGLAGEHFAGSMKVCYATTAVSSTSAGTTRVGGLVGLSWAPIGASYATGAVSATASGMSASARAGGLIGHAGAGTTVTNSYARGAVSATGTGATAGGLIASTSTTMHAVASYWDQQTTGQTTSAGGVGQNTADLQAPTGYTGIYAAWNTYDTDGNGAVNAADDAWNFGSSSNYPVLTFAGLQLDYDDDDDNLIDLRNLVQLNAIRHDLNGDGVPAVTPGVTIAVATANHAAAFPRAFPGMGCPSTCRGYELRNDLNFDTNRDGTVNSSDPGSYANWVPIGNRYDGRFEGNLHTIANLTMSGSGSEVGLFARLGSTAVVTRLGLVSPSVARTTNGLVGALVGSNRGATIFATWVAGGTVSFSLTVGGGTAGGLVGEHESGLIKASYATTAVSGTSTLQPIVGGLVGIARAPIAASYASGAVSASATGTGNARAGGLVGFAGTGTTVTNSYARGSVSATGTSAQAGGLIGLKPTSLTMHTVASYWDQQTSGQTTSAGGVGQNTADLQAPTGYTGIYSAWNTYDTDGDGTVDADDDAWNFGGSSSYPVLTYGGLLVDYDDDNDNLIDVRNLAQLNAIRYDLNGDGAATNAAVHSAAFPRAVPGVGCPSTCRGYELRNDLDFDTNGDGTVNSADAGSYPNWAPIGTYTAVFDGNGQTISHLTINRDTTHSGLFGQINSAAIIRSVGMIDASVQGGGGANYRAYGTLVGVSDGTVAASYARGGAVTVTQQRSSAGGLVGDNFGSILASYSTVAVSSGAHPRVVVGGLTGYNGDSSRADVIASYAAGAVSGTGSFSAFGGLVGYSQNANDRFTNSYCDTTVGLTSCVGQSQGAAAPVGYATAALQEPTGYTGIYENWNIDLDGDNMADDPWHFGAADEYPSLKWGGHDPTRQFASPPPAPMPEPEGDGAPPTDVRTEPSGTGLLVTWAAVPGASSYLVQWRSVGQAWSSSRQAETTETRYVIPGLGAGEYEVRVLTVIDGEAGAPSEPERGDVDAPGNNAPRVLGIAAIDMDVGATAWVDLAAAFEDPDGDALRFAATVEGDAATAAVASAQRLRLRGERAGEATVVVTATDPEGLSATARFTVRVGAVLSLVGDTAVPEGGVLTLQAELSRALDSDLEVRWRIGADDDETTADADAADFAVANVDPAQGAATIAAGQTAATIEIAVAEDEAIEPAREHFAVELLAPEHGNVGLSRRQWRALASVQEGVCDRTPEVRAELSRGWRACHWPRPSGLAQLTLLDLRGRGVTALQADDLLGLSSLRTLDLGGNALRELPSGLLAHSPQLRSLRLDDNELESLPAGLFAGVSALRELRLAENPGAPFALTPELRRIGALPWAAGPARVQAVLTPGAPFAMSLALTATGAESSAESLLLAAGAVESDAAWIVGNGSPARVSLAAPTIPDSRCGDDPCFNGLTTQGATLVLFAEPPSVASELAPVELLGGADTVRIDLSPHFAASEAGGSLTYTASVNDPRLAFVGVAGATLTVTANEDLEEGTATVTVVATDETGQTATLHFEVEISPRPVGNWRGWRSTVAPPAAGQ